MLLVAYLRKYSDRRLSDAERERLRIMIKRSDNDAATEVRDIVGNGALERLADKAGFHCFATSAASWGSTQICARDMALFMKEIERLLPSRYRGFALTLLKRIVRKQRWGIPRRSAAPGRRCSRAAGTTTRPTAGACTRSRCCAARAARSSPSRCSAPVSRVKGYGTDTVTKVARRALVGPVTRCRGGKR